ncbi:IS1478 transposase (plasmid) [Cupriavidus necator H850]|nr:IS1478 transposase [Cupriavidus necator H850]
MVVLLYLKHAYNESDESVCERWAQDVYYQFFSGGQEYFEPRLPCDPTNLVRSQYTSTVPKTLGIVQPQARKRSFSSQAKARMRSP